MLLRDAPLTFREFMTHEETPLAVIFRELLTFLGEREDAILFGAQAVNAYCEPARMTEDVDVLTTEPIALAEAIRSRLADRFHMAARVREASAGPPVGLRVYQVRKPKNRHLADVRGVEKLPPFRLIEGVRVIAPDDLAAMKAVAIVARAGREKSLTDRVDLARLLRAFPDLREEARIRDVCARAGASEDAASAWRDTARIRLEPDDDDDLA